MSTAETYFQVAAANLRNAILERQNQANQLKAEIAQKEQDFKHQKDELERAKNTKMRESGDSGIDDRARAVLVKEAQDDEKALREAEKAFNEERDKLTKDIYLIESDFGLLHKILKDIDMRAQNPT